MDRIFGGSWSYKSQTQTAGTAITQLIAPKRGKNKVRVTNMVYRSGTTAHSPILMLSHGYTVTTAAAAAAQADIVLSTLEIIAGEALAASDYIAFENTDGTFAFGVVDSVASLTVTLSANLAKAVSAGARVWGFYEVGRATHLSFLTAASARSAFSDPISGICTAGDVLASTGVTTSGYYEPILFYSANTTAAGFLEALSGYYARF